MDFEASTIREPSSIMLDFDNLPQHTMDLENRGVISFGKRTVQRPRGDFKVFVNSYWNIPSGVYVDDSNKKKYLRTLKDVRKFMKDNDYHDPVLNPSGTKGSPDGPEVLG